MNWPEIKHETPRLQRHHLWYRTETGFVCLGCKHECDGYGCAHPCTGLKLHYYGVCTSDADVAYDDYDEFYLSQAVVDTLERPIW